MITTDPYLDAVALALADLDPSDRDELLEDLHLHLVELRAEDGDVDLVARLGTPQSYAAELRTAAGLGPATAGPTRVERLRSSRDALLRRASDRPWARAVLDFLPQLRPAWWVVRAYGVVQLVDWWAHPGAYRWNDGVVPQVHGSRTPGLLLLAALVVVSVRLATRPPSWRRWSRVALAANVVLAVATLGYFASLGGVRTSYEYVQQSGPCCGSLYGDNGVVYDNLYGYDEQGHLVPQLQLFDQNGSPVSVTVYDGQGTSRQTNVFPHPQVQEDGTFAVPTPPPFGGPVVVAPAPTPKASPVR